MLTTKKWGATQRRRALPRAGGPGWVAAAALAWLALGLVGCGPRGATALLTGERLIREGRPAEAIEPLKRAVELLGTNTTACAQAWNHLGLAYHHVGDWTNAARAYQNALSRDFNLIAARYNRGCLFLEQNQLVGAINELTTYTAYDPNHTDAWLRLGTAQLRSRQLDDAERSFSQVLRLDSSPAEKAESLNGLGLGQVLRRKPREAFAYFHAALKHQTNYAPTLLNQAIVAHYQLNDRAAALPCYQAYLAAQPQAASNAILLATIRKLEDELRPPPPPPPSPPAAAALAQTTPTPPVTEPPPAPTAPPPPPSTTSPGALASGATSTLAQPPPKVPPTRPPSSPPVAAVPPAGRPDPTESVTTAPPPRVEPEPTPTPEPPPTRTVALPARPEPTPTPPTPSVPADTASPAATPSPTEVAPPEPSPPAITLADSLRARVEAEARTAEAAADATAEKRSLLQRLNPLGWFGSGRDEESAVKTPTPIPPPAVSGDLAQAAGRTAPGPSPPGSPATGVTGAARQLLGPTPSASAPVPAFPRYAYGAPRAVASGNRAQAERTFAQGVVAQRSGRLGEAIEAYRSALQQDPSFFDAHYNLGVALQDRADWAGALTAYEQALALRPTDADARFNFALALQSSGYPQDAALEFGNLLASRPNYVDAHFAVANLYAQTLDQRDQAREHYQRVLQLQPDHPQAAAIRRWLSVNR